MSTNNVAAVAAVATRRQDIPTSLIFEAHVAANQAGETIDGLVTRISKQTGITFKDENDRKGFIAVLNVRRSNIRKKIEGEFQAERTDLEKNLASAITAHGEASTEANAVRADIRELAKTEASMLSVLELARRGRTGDKPGMSFRSLLANAVLKSVSPADATSADATPADNVNDIDVE